MVTVIDVGRAQAVPDGPKIKRIDVSKAIHPEGLEAEIRARLKKRIIGISTYGADRAAILLDEDKCTAEDLAFVDAAILAHDPAAAQAALLAKDAQDEAREVDDLLTAISEVDGRTLRKVLRGLFKRIRKLEQDNDALRLDVDALKAK